MEIQSPKRLDDLEEGIKQLLLENRCSFSEKDIDLLNECLKIVQDLKAQKDKEETTNPMLLINLGQLFLKFFEVFIE